MVLRCWGEAQTLPSTSFSPSQSSSKLLAIHSFSPSKYMPIQGHCSRELTFCSLSPTLQLPVRWYRSISLLMPGNSTIVHPHNVDFGSVNESWTLCMHSSCGGSALQPTKLCWCLWSFLCSTFPLLVYSEVWHLRVASGALPDTNMRMKASLGD